MKKYQVNISFPYFKKLILKVLQVSPELTFSAASRSGSLALHLPAVTRGITSRPVGVVSCCHQQRLKSFQSYSAKTNKIILQ
jgi:hypothetical protein